MKIIMPSTRGCQTKMMSTLNFKKVNQHDYIEEMLKAGEAAAKVATTPAKASAGERLLAQRVYDPRAKVRSEVLALLLLEAVSRSVR